MASTQASTSAAGRRKATLQPFPDIPPLSQPLRPTGDRGASPRGEGHEVVEISD